MYTICANINNVNGVITHVQMLQILTITRRQNKCVWCNAMLSNVENINNHREKNQEMPNPMQRGAKVFSNLKIFKAAKRTLP